MTGSVSERPSDYRRLSVHGMMATGTVSLHGRRWFVKSLAPQYRDITEAKAMLAKEFDILLSLRHESIVRPLSMQELPEAGLSIIMEYIDGETLSDYLTHAGRRERRKIASALVDAVAFLHRNGITHGDLKPDNILVSGTVDEPRVTLIDFNLSDGNVYTAAKGVGGNRKYAAPEQFEAGYTPSPRADVWSLGRLLSEINPGPDWIPAIRGALRENPQQRFQDASAFAITRRKIHRLGEFSLAILFFLSAVAVLVSFFSQSQYPEQKAVTTSVDSIAHSSSAANDGIAGGSLSSPTAVPVVVEQSSSAPATATQQPPTDPNQDWEARHSDLMNESKNIISSIRKDIAGELADYERKRSRGEFKTKKAVTEGRDYYRKRYLALSTEITNTVIQSLGMFVYECPQSVLAAHPKGWGTPDDPLIQKDYKAMTNDLNKLIQLSTELNREAGKLRDGK